MRAKKGVLSWKVNTPGLIKEYLTNNNAILLRPSQIFARLLYSVAKRAAELNDPELNRLMRLLTLYQKGRRKPEAKAWRKIG